jgi:drug/metabolite transporter (DMT)-like permease
MEPLMAVLLGALFLDERLSARQGVGGLLILTAAILLARADAPRPSEPGRAPEPG